MIRNRHGEPSDALFACERQILDLWDGGWAIQRIARVLGRKRSYVARVVHMYDGTQDERRAVAAARASSEALVAACRATGSAFR